MTDIENKIQLKVLRKVDTIKQVGLSKTSLFELAKEGLFPPLIKIGPRAAGYLEHEVTAVVAARAAGRSEDEIKALVEHLVNQRETNAISFSQGFLA